MLFRPYFLAAFLSCFHIAVPVNLLHCFLDLLVGGRELWEFRNYGDNEEDTIVSGELLKAMYLE